MSTFTFARRTLDPGLFSDNADVMQRFYTDTVGLPLLERLEHDDSYAEIFFELPDIDRIADNWDEVIAWRETGDVPVA